MFDTSKFGPAATGVMTMGGSGRLMLVFVLQLTMTCSCSCMTNKRRIIDSSGASALFGLKAAVQPPAAVTAVRHWLSLCRDPVHAFTAGPGCVSWSDYLWGSGCWAGSRFQWPSLPGRQVVMHNALINDHQQVHVLRGTSCSTCVKVSWCRCCQAWL